MRTPEPVLREGDKPEEPLQEAVVREVHRILKLSGNRYILIESFGLDVAAFFRQGEHSYSRFLELKAFAGSRAGGIGFGHRKGLGAQVDLLLHSGEDLRIVDQAIRWILVNWLRPAGAKRYTFFTSVRAKKAAMNGVERDKQNNIRISDFDGELITWGELCEEMSSFLLTEKGSY